MKHLRQRFIAFYYNVLRKDVLFTTMDTIFENSPWHRETSVLIHTDMVVSNYISLIQETVTPDKWLLGALSCAFHDVGKPAAEETMFSEERGEYRRYAGHEMISSRMWEDWATSNWGLLSSTFPELTVRSVVQVGWIIQHHLPFSLKDKNKVSRLVHTARDFIGDSVFATCLEADCRGRISDDHQTKLQNTLQWIEDVLNNTEYANRELPDTDKTCHILIGASGSGKSTHVGVLMDRAPRAIRIHSMDAMRLKLYGEPYATAYQLSTEDNTFKSQVQQDFMDILRAGHDVIVDNTNVSVKSRGFYVQEARKKGYEIVATVFPVALNVVLGRQDTRPDKSVPREAVIRQYNSIQLPFYGEVDYINVYGSNVLQ